MLKSNYAAVLFDRGLSMLPTAMYVAKRKEMEQLKQMIKDKTGIDIDTSCTPDLTDEEIAELKTFEDGYRQFLLAIVINNDFDDPFHIRYNREMSLIEHNNSQINDNRRNLFRFSMAVFFIGIAYLFMITWLPIPDNSTRFADMGIGLISATMLQPVMAYWFGNKFDQNIKDLPSIKDDHKKDKKPQE